jgi:RNA polymerase sigma-70 factor (subfamily 1)
MCTELQAAQLAVYVERWILEARGGSRAALEQLMESCFPYLFAVARRDLCTTLRSRLDPGDVVQDTLMKAWQHFPQFRGVTEADLHAWLRQILHNNLANEGRKHVQSARRSIQRELRLVEAAAMSRPEDADSEPCLPNWQALTLERHEALGMAMRRLPARYRQVLYLHTQEEMTFAQVGEHLHCSAEAARKLWKRAARKLAWLLEDSCRT